MESSTPTAGRARRLSAVVTVVVIGLSVLASGCMNPGWPPRTTTTTTTDPGGPTTTEPNQPGGGRLPAADENANGPFAVTVDQNAGANSWVFRPTNLGQGGVTHPIFVWGTGATSVPSQYRDHFTRMASHGIVVISPNTGSVNGNLLKQSLSWIIAQNTANGIYRGKLNTSEIAMGGHSLGSVSTFDAEATLNNLKTTIHIAGGSFDGRGSSKVKTPTAYMCGGSGDIAKAQCDVDFQNAATNPTYYAVLSGTGHIDAARKALPAMIAWLRWHLNGETNRKAQFSPGGTYFQGIFQAKVKNWN